MVPERNGHQLFWSARKHDLLEGFIAQETFRKVHRCSKTIFELNGEQFRKSNVNVISPHFSVLHGEPDFV